VTRALQAFTDADGVEISYRRWLPDGRPRAIVQIAHGASEHSGRYARFADFLVQQGYAVYANDHRGHGVTAAATGVGRGGPRGWNGMVDDLRELNAIARAEFADVPLVLFGHSMGSFLAQLFAQRYGDEIDGLVLSGSAGGLPGMAEALAALDSAVAAGGVDQPAGTFAGLNAAFEPARTPFDWLSRDPDEVDAYIADPMCGDDAPLTIGLVHDMMRSSLETFSPEQERRLPKDLPVLLITGEADPVSQQATTVRELEARYHANGMTNVTAYYYADARHELLNETNRDDVQADVAGWLAEIAPGG
jgi:alpha-beta hydrolase superfamily lysophospholipase